MVKKLKFFILLIAIVLMFACSKRMGKDYNNKIKLFNSFPIEVTQAAAYLVHSNSVYISDMQSDLRTRKYDFNGKLIFEFGNKGEGPGEFSSIGNLFYDVDKKCIGIEDMFLRRITYIDTLGSLINTKREKQGKQLGPFGVKNSSTANVKLSYSVKVNKAGKMFFNYELELDKINSTPQVIKKEILQSSLKFSQDVSLSIDLNEKYIFYCKFPHQFQFKASNYHVTMFDYSGNKKEWKPKFVPSKIKRMGLFHVSDKYIFIHGSYNDNGYDLIYDFSGNYLGYLKFDNGDYGGVVKVKNGKIFVLNNSGDDSILEIYDIDF